MPRQSDSSRKPRQRPSVTARPSRAANERQRAIVQAVGADEEKLHHALSKADAPTGAALVSQLGRQVGNAALHRFLTHAKPAAATDMLRAIHISFGGQASASSFDAAMRASLEAILRAAGAHSARVVGIGSKQGVSFFDVAPGSVDPESAFVSAAEAEVGNRLACFYRPPRYPAFHFEIHH